MESNIFKNAYDAIHSAIMAKLESGTINTEDAPNAIKELCRNEIENISEQLFATIINSHRENLKLRKKIHDGFLKRLHGDWGRGFDLMETYIASSGELACGFMRSDAWEINELNGVLLRLHGRACQVTSEVLVLMRNGFADGAYARWRTLHEIAVTCLFLNKHGTEAARRYVAANAVESYKMALKFVSCHKKTGCEIPDNNTMTCLKNNCDKVKKEYGDEISEQYGWASPYIGIKRPNFSHIEENVDLEHFRKNYGLASNNVHGNIKGLTSRISLLDDTDVILAGPSNSGFVEPGHSAAISLLQVNVALLKYEPLTLAIYITLLMKICTKIGEYLLESHGKILEKHKKNGMIIGQF